MKGKNMKILFISTSPLEYSSSANVRNLALIKGLIQLGHKVSTCTAKPEKTSLYYDNSLLNIPISNHFYIDISTMHSRFTSKNSNSNSYSAKVKQYIKKKVYKLYSALSVYDPRKSLLSMVGTNSISGTFDLIISSSDPKSSHLLAEKLIKINPTITKKWIQYWGDPFTNDINKKTLIPNWIIKHEEKRLLKLANAVVYVSPFTLQHQTNLFPLLKGKMHFLPVPYMDSIIYPNHKNESINLGYFGDYYSSDRNIIPLYDAVVDSDVCLQVFGHSDLTLESTNKIQINPRVNYDIIKKSEEKSDLLVCICNKRGTQIPGKVYHYAATNKPILVILDGEYKKELRDYFETFDRYILCDNTIESISKAINNFKDSHKDYAPSRSFDPLTIASSFIELTYLP